MNKNLTSLAQSLADEPVRNSEVLFGVLAWLIVELKVKVLKQVITLGVSLTSHIQDVCDTSVDQLSCLEGTVERPHVNAIVDFDKADVTDVNITAAEVVMRESRADDLFLLPIVVLSVIVQVSPVLLLVQRLTAALGLGLLEL